MEYYNIFLDVLSSDNRIRGAAIKGLRADDESLFLSDGQLIKFINWMTNTWEWIENKRVVFFVAIDNLGYLSYVRSEIEETYDQYLQNLNQLRNNLKNFVFVFSGTNEDWGKFTDYIHTKTNHAGQLRGLIHKTYDLDPLPKDDMMEALRLRMLDFWKQNKMAPKGVYPFSENFFEYLYELHVKDLRKMLIDLNEIWEQKYRNTGIVTEFSDDLKMMQFIRKEWKPSSDSETFDGIRLLPFEEIALKNRWHNWIASFASNERSKTIENKLRTFIEVLRDEEVPRKIRLVTNKKQFKFKKADGTAQIRKPDVYIELSTGNKLDHTRSFEIQVKIHESGSYVGKKEILGSIDSLYHKQMDALVFLLTGPGLNDNSLRYIKEKSLETRLLMHDPFVYSQEYVLYFMAFFDEIMEQKPSITVVRHTLDALFKNWNNLLDSINSMTKFAPYEPSLEELKESDSRSFDEIPIQSPLEATTVISTDKNPPPSSQIDVLFSRYQKHHNLIIVLLNIIANRKDENAFQAAHWSYIKNKIPGEYDEEKVRKVYDKLRKDAKSEMLLLLEIDGRFLKITDIGLKFIEKYG